MQEQGARQTGFLYHPIQPIEIGLIGFKGEREVTIRFRGFGKVNRNHAIHLLCGRYISAAYHGKSDEHQTSYMRDTNNAIGRFRLLVR
jgi:hypothetical protein